MSSQSEFIDWKQEIDKALGEWRQGDFVLGNYGFIYQYVPGSPLSADSQVLNPSDGDLGRSEVKGLVVVTQTCDIVRKCSQRPFVEVVPLVEMDKEVINEIKRGRRPQYAYIPGIEDKWLVADLDRVMTVEKTVLANWDRKEGCQTDLQIRNLGRGLGRKRSRYAFPDDFNELVENFRKRVTKKHDKLSSEGEALRFLEEIRVRAAPSWNDQQVEIKFYFLSDEDDYKVLEVLEGYCNEWLGLISVPSGRFVSVEGEVFPMETFSAKEYVESDSLDLDNLSMQTEG